MKNVAATFALVFLISTSGFTQQSIDKSIQFPPGMGFRNYHIYIPSGYDMSTPSKFMVGFHPFNTSRWNGESWRDSLITFVENANLLLICPDGGSDGRIDGQDDYEFIKAMIDSMHVWYNIDVESTFGIGFSVGGKAVYEFGMNNRSTFKGLIPIGAAMNGTSTVDDILHRSKCQNYYIIHGQSDAPQSRYYPIKDSLVANEANVEVTFMAGVGHTFDFPSRNQILMQAFRYIDTADCNYTGIDENLIAEKITITPNIVNIGQSLYIDFPTKFKEVKVVVYDLNGAKKDPLILWNSEDQIEIKTSLLSTGLYIVHLEGSFGQFQQKIYIR